MEIRIDISEYNKSVELISKANSRSVNNNNNFNIIFSNSDSNMITHYGDAIQKLKTALSIYSERLTGDISKLYTIRDEVDAMDKKLATRRVTGSTMASHNLR